MLSENEGYRFQVSGFSPDAGQKKTDLIEKETLKNRMTKGGIAALYLFR